MNCMAGSNQKGFAGFWLESSILFKSCRLKTKNGELAGAMLASTSSADPLGASARTAKSLSLLLEFSRICHLTDQ